MPLHPPLIGLSSCVALRNGGAYHEVKDQYHEAVLSCTGGLSVGIPAMADQMDLSAYIARLDGLVLTGSLSNVHPGRYGAAPSSAAEPYDVRRDELTFALLEKGLAARLPILCICRGFQEAAVYFGSTLYAEVHKVPGLHDHRRPDAADLAGQFGFNHSVTLHDGLWARWLGMAAGAEVMVNSLHLQGIKDLGAGLHIEATAPDGLVEAFSAPDQSGFFWAAQFHPEWDAAQVPQYRVIFEAFGAACAARLQAR